MSKSAPQFKSEKLSSEIAKERLNDVLVSGPQAVILNFPNKNSAVSELHTHATPMEVPARAQDLESILPAPPPMPSWSEKPEEMSVAMWIRNVFVGACILFVDASIKAFKPVGFIWEHMHLVAQATFVLALPLLTTLMMLHHIPKVGQLYVAGTLQGGVYLLTLYIASSILLLFGRFASVFLFKGLVKLLHRFAAYGAEHYPLK